MVAKSSASGQQSSLNSHQERKYIFFDLHKDCFPNLYSLNLKKNALLSHQNVAKEIFWVDPSATFSIERAEYIGNCLDKGEELKLTCKWGFNDGINHSQ